MRALSRRVSTPLWSIVVLFLIAVALSVAAYLAAVHDFQVSQAAQARASATQARQAAEQQASQQRQGQQLEQKLCTTLNGLAELQPPSGATESNPSRVFDVQLHAKLSQLGPDVGCKR